MWRACPFVKAPMDTPVWETGWIDGEGDRWMHEVWTRNARLFLPLPLSVIPLSHPCSKELFTRRKVLWSFATCGPTGTLSPVSLCNALTPLLIPPPSFSIQCLFFICKKKKINSISFPLVETLQLFIYYQQSFTKPLDVCSWVRDPVLTCTNEVLIIDFDNTDWTACILH